MQDTDYKEVFFNQYCKKCKYGLIPENQEPCSECLEEPINQHSHKPVKYEEK